MKISARNQLAGKITEINEGVVNAIVSLDVNGTILKGTISMAAVKELGLAPGVDASAIIKATEIMVGLGEMKLSARNKLAGKVTSITEGAVNSMVSLDVCGGKKVTATISKEAVKELGLEVGKDAVAVIKATSVMFAIA